MNTSDKSIQKHFDQVPKQWDALYSNESKIINFINRFLRKGLYERHHLTFENCGDIIGARVLDIGCGTGRYSIDFALKGASEVVGIDFAPAMVEFCQLKADEMGVSSKCRFICCDFLDFEFEEPFDIVAALGFFDYVKDPKPYFDKVSAVTKGRFLASFPNNNILWMTQRRIRYYMIKKCAVYFYHYDKLDSLFKQAKFGTYSIIALDKGYFGIGDNF